MMNEMRHSLIFPRIEHIVLTIADLQSTHLA